MYGSSTFPGIRHTTSSSQWRYGRHYNSWFQISKRSNQRARHIKKSLLLIDKNEKTNQMSNSLNKAFTGAIALALIVIAVGRIPFSREKELSNLCREYYTMYLNQNDYSLKENTKIKVIAKKTGLKAETNNVGNFCNSFYFNQR